MASEIRTVGKHALVYGTGVVIGKLASFLMLPIYTRFLTPVDYGVLELLALLIDVVGMLAGLGFISGLYKFYSEADGAAEKADVMGTAAIGSLILAVGGAAVGLLLASPLNRIVIGENGSPTYVRIFFLVYLVQTVSAVPLAFLRAENRSVLFVVANTAKLIMTLSLNIYFVVHLRMGVLGVLLSSVTGETVIAAGLGIFFLRHVGIRFSRRHLRALLDFGRPMVLWSLGSFVLVFSDRFFLKHYSGTAQVGIYSLAYQFAFVLYALASTPFMTAWEPRRFEVAKRADAQQTFSRVFVYLNIVVGLAGAGIALFVHDLLRVMSAAAFWPAARVVPLLVAAQIVFMWANFCNVGLFIRGESRVMAKIAVRVALVTILLNFAFIPSFGVWGAALATAAAYLVRFILIYNASQRAYHVAYDWKSIAKLYAVIVVLVMARLAGTTLPMSVSIPLATVLFAIAVCWAYGRVLAPSERAAFRSFLASLGRRFDWRPLASRMGLVRS